MFTIFCDFQASDVRIIRVFISSTFTDTAQERNLLIADGSCLSDVFVMIVIVHNKPMKALILSGTPIHG